MKLSRNTLTRLSFLLPAAWAWSAYAAGWEELLDEEGIQVARREVPGSSLLEFRGRGRVDASMLRIAAVIREGDRHKEWMKNCTSSRVVEYVSATKTIGYHRTESPSFMVSDRDVVLEGSVAPNATREHLRITFVSRAHPEAPETDAVRMPRLQGHWDLTRVDGETTLVEYRVTADPGGWLPKLLANWAAERLPFETIQALRRQVQKPGYETTVAVLEAALDLEPETLGRR